MARHVLHDGHGTQPDERDQHRVGAHAVARGAAGGVGGVERSRCPDRRDAARPAVGSSLRVVKEATRPHRFLASQALIAAKRFGDKRGNESDQKTKAADDREVHV